MGTPTAACDIVTEGEWYREPTELRIYGPLFWLPDPFQGYRLGSMSESDDLASVSLEENTWSL